jgi:uncharacterized membrane protein YhaH (DUF805 family)
MEYNGNNTYNNCISIDYEKKEVSFVPIKDGIPFFDVLSLAGNYVTAVEIIMCYCIILLLILSNFITLDINDSSIQMLITILAILLGLCTLFAIIVCSIKELRHKYYPTLQKKGVQYIQILLFFIPIIKRKTFKIVKDNKIVIDFQNVYIKYELKEEFSKYLKRINIKNKVEGSSQDGWTCTFEFSQEPLKGELWVEYH